MEIWLDTCDYRAVGEASQLGILTGVTTNPLILAKSRDSTEKTLSKLLDIQDGPVAAQVLGRSTQEMVTEGRAFHKFSDRILVKVPVTQAGIAAITTLKSEGIAVLATVIFHPHQVLLAAIAGADYAAPYIGRMFDAGIDAYASLKTMETILQQHRLETKILAASLQNTDQLLAVAEMGISAVTLKPSLFSTFLADDPLTLEALESFEAAYK